MTRVAVRAIHQDLLEHTRSVLSDGAGTFDGKVLSCRECPPFQGSDRIILGDGEITLIHEGDTRSEIHLDTRHPGAAEIKTPYGTMFCDAQLLAYRRTETSVSVEYQILQNGEILSHIALDYEFRPLV
jgi:hypothetical protein